MREQQAEVDLLANWSVLENAAFSHRETGQVNGGRGDAGAIRGRRAAVTGPLALHMGVGSQWRASL